MFHRHVRRAALALALVLPCVRSADAQAGATAAKSVIKDWTNKGGRVLVSSRPMPIKQLIMSAKASPEEQQQVRNILVGIAQNDAGKQVLGPLGYKGFVAPNHDEERKAIAWLGL